MSKTSIPNAPLPFDELAEAIKGRRSVYGLISGLRLDRAAPGEAWSSLPYRPVFVGDTKTGVLHGGVVTAMLDESCGMAVQLALDGTRAIATLDLRIDYQKPATPGLDIEAHSVSGPVGPLLYPRPPSDLGEPLCKSFRCRRPRFR